MDPKPQTLRGPFGFRARAIVSFGVAAGQRRTPMQRLLETQFGVGLGLRALAITGAYRVWACMVFEVFRLHDKGLRIYGFGF